MTTPRHCPTVQVAAILRRNDGECHLQPNMEGFDDYVRNPEQVGS